MTRETCPTEAYNVIVTLQDGGIQIIWGDPGSVSIYPAMSRERAINFIGRMGKINGVATLEAMTNAQYVRDENNHVWNINTGEMIR